MAELDIFDVAPEKYFPYDDDSEVLIQYQGKEVLSSIVRKAEEIERKTRVPAKDIANKLTGRKAVKHWRKTTDHEHPGLTIGGKAVEFTPANIDMLMTKSIDFSNFVNQKCIDSRAFRDNVDVNIDSIADELFGSKAEAEEENDQKNAL